MKKLLLGLPLAVLLIGLSLTGVSAGVDWEDPALCVNGQWLMIDAAHPPAVTVSVPKGTRYGDQSAGGCATPGPNAPLITQVKETGGDPEMKVQVDGKYATASVTASYGMDRETKKNNGKQMLHFKFQLPKH